MSLSDLSLGDVSDVSLGGVSDVSLGGGKGLTGGGVSIGGSVVRVLLVRYLHSPILLLGVHIRWIHSNTFWKFITTMGFWRTRIWTSSNGRICT